MNYGGPRRACLLPRPGKDLLLEFCAPATRVPAMPPLRRRDLSSSIQLRRGPAPRRILSASGPALGPPSVHRTPRPSAACVRPRARAAHVSDGPSSLLPATASGSGLAKSLRPPPSPFPSRALASIFARAAVPLFFHGSNCTTVLAFLLSDSAKSCAVGSASARIGRRTLSPAHPASLPLLFPSLPPSAIPIPDRGVPAPAVVASPARYLFFLPLYGRAPVLRVALLGSFEYRSRDRVMPARGQQGRGWPELPHNPCPCASPGGLRSGLVRRARPSFFFLGRCHRRPRSRASRSASFYCHVFDRKFHVRTSLFGGLGAWKALRPISGSANPPARPRELRPANPTRA